MEHKFNDLRELTPEQIMENLDQLQAENEKLKELVDTVLISCNPPEDCNDVDVLKTYMKACLDKANELKEK